VSQAAILAAALLLDAAMGEPAWLWSRLPHPAVLMGRAVGLADESFNTGPNRRLAGALVLAGLVLCAVGLGVILHWTGWLVELVVVAVLLAQRSLADHVSAVASALGQGLPAAREAVGRIVGRDTAAMTEEDVARAAIESAAENLSDGVVAPALFYLVFGLPGLLTYKLVNTADSMIGHRTPRHEEFGWAAARFDDLLNLVPARATALILAALDGRIAEWREILRDARRHRSPNAGWPEAAMARGLGVALSGPRSYGGERRDFPFVNGEGRRDAGAGDIERAVATLWLVWWVLFGLAVVLALAALA